MVFDIDLNGGNANTFYYRDALPKCLTIEMLCHHILPQKCIENKERYYQ